MRVDAMEAGERAKRRRGVRGAAADARGDGEVLVEGERVGSVDAEGGAEGGFGAGDEVVERRTPSPRGGEGEEGASALANGPVTAKDGASAIATVTVSPARPKANSVSRSW